MKILVVGNESCLIECRQKFGDSPEYFRENTRKEAQKMLSTIDCVFDFLTEEDTSSLGIYDVHPEGVVFLNTAKTNLVRLNRALGGAASWIQFGFSGMPTFLRRDVLEVSLYKKEHLQKLVQVCHQLGTHFQVVEDRVGLVTPRVICMIINEAYFTVEEGIASREDIDLAMKLGTSYPFGPFEWCQKIGARRVVELLEAVYEDTQDERYRISPMLKGESLLH